MGIREIRLVQELKHMERLHQQSTFIEFLSEDDPPDKYLVFYSCKGMITSSQWSNNHAVQIYLHTEYPRLAPQVSFLTPIFHPNIAAPLQIGRIQADIRQMLESIHDESQKAEIEKELFKNAELFKARVCLDILDLNWSPSITLDMVCLEIGEMIQYKRYNPAHPMNHEAAEWAQTHQELLPVDTRSLLDLKELESIRVLSTITMDDPEDDIRIL